MVRLKDNFFEDFLQRWTEFQFLMVRLKAFNYITRGAFYRISIPYGAIKSLNEKHQIAVMVHFNSLWCD